MTAYPHLAARLFNTPLGIRADKAEVIVASVAERFGIGTISRGGDAVTLSGPAARAFLDGADPRLTERVSSAAERGVGYDVVQGIAVIGIEGTLVQRLGALRPQSGMTGYDGLRANLTAALQDRQVRGIALLCNSPGGEVPGAFDLADQIAASRDVKPIWAILDEMACSCAYLMASAASLVVTPRTGITGSIGIIAIHTEASRAIDRAGVTVNLIRSSPRKMEGNELEPLTRLAQERIQASIDKLADLFFATVARNRGLNLDAIRAQDAAWFEGEEGVAAGLADAVMPADDAFQALIEATA